MKKLLLGAGALLLSAASGLAQESRQDASLSATYLFSEQINANAVQLNTTTMVGALASYRYMVTPRSALEANYGFGQYSSDVKTSFNPYVRFHTRQQEFSVAYVYSVNFHNFNPFIEAGPGALVLTPLRDFKTTQFDGKRNTSIGGLFGAGIAYELSPSFDLRVEYRGFVAKSPNFGLTQYTTGRYEVFSSPSVGVAYHF